MQDLDISVGKSRLETNWKHQKITWADLVKKLSKTVRTKEKYKDYIKLDKEKQAKIKDIGAFVGGLMQGGRRKKGSVISRQIITLDLDEISTHFSDHYDMVLGVAAVIYSTHKHSVTKPRLRLVMPMSRPVTADEYQPIARKVAELLGVHKYEGFDHTTFQVERLMHWPSTAIDGDYYYEEKRGSWIDPDEILGMFKDWRDHSEWPCMSDKELKIRSRAKKQGNPLEKPGVIGAFCRSYTISEAIEKFLPDVYTESATMDGRYTYNEGSTANGLVIYDDDLYCYSHHNTDPISGKLCNAFDLVRIHLFGDTDERAKADTPTNKLPSYNRMLDLAIKQPVVKKKLASEKRQEVIDDFSDGVTDMGELGTDSGTDKVDDDWEEKLEFGRKGVILGTIDNIVLIIENTLKGKLQYDLLTYRKVIKGKLPWKRALGDKFWTDADDSGLRWYLEYNYGITGVGKIEDALDIVFEKNSYHPVRDYIKNIVWDGERRIDTVLIDYLGADKSDYVRAVTRKALIACVARVFTPGIKFDNMLILIGKQGIGKSTLLKKLGKEWFSESFSFHMIGTKEAVEALVGYWIIETGELVGFKKADVDAIKHFISKQHDDIRLAYQRNMNTFQRQCVLFASTNNEDPLQDPTGNRRFWPVKIDERNAMLNVFTELESSVDQIWAEAYYYYKKGEQLHLSKELEEAAQHIQELHTEEDPREVIIRQYLDTLIPDEYETWDVYQRREYLRGDDMTIKKQGKLRMRVNIQQICTEALQWPEKEVTPYTTRPIHNIMRMFKDWERKAMRFGKSIDRGYVRISYSISKSNVSDLN